MTLEELETLPSLREALTDLRAAFAELNSLERMDRCGMMGDLSAPIEDAWRKIHRTWWRAVHIPTGGG